MSQTNGASPKAEEKAARGFDMRVGEDRECPPIPLPPDISILNRRPWITQEQAWAMRRALEEIREAASGAFAGRLDHRSVRIEAVTNIDRIAYAVLHDLPPSDPAP
jgi:hypothetical protein